MAYFITRLRLILVFFFIGTRLAIAIVMLWDGRLARETLRQDESRFFFSDGQHSHLEGVLAHRVSSGIQTFFHPGLQPQLVKIKRFSTECTFSTV